MTSRDELVEAIRDPILLWIENEWNMIASVESDELAALLVDKMLPVIERREADVLRRVRASIEALRDWQDVLDQPDLYHYLIVTEVRHCEAVLQSVLAVVTDAGREEKP